MATQTNAEKMSIFKYWFEFVKPREFPTLADVHSNGQKIGDYIDREFSGVFSILFAFYPKMCSLFVPKHCGDSHAGRADRP